MPWTTADVASKTKAAKTKAQKERWVSVANSALASCIKERGASARGRCEGYAIRVANAAVRRGVAESKMDDFIEVTEALSGIGPDTRIDRENRVIHNVAALSPNSENERFYEPSAMSQAVGLLEGKKVFCDHPDLRDLSKTRSVRDLIGRLRAVNIAASKVRADFHVLKGQEWVMDLAESDPDAAGLSINARVLARRGSDPLKIVGFDKIRSCDLVTEPATTKSIFESKTPTEDIVDVLKDSVDDIIGLLENQRADVLEAIREEVKTDMDEKAVIAGLTTERDGLKVEVDELQTKMDALEAEKNKDTRLSMVEQKIKDAKLADGIVSDFFKEQLLEAEDEKAIDALIADRVKLATAGNTPTSTVGGEPELTSEQLVEAIRGSE